MDAAVIHVYNSEKSGPLFLLLAVTGKEHNFLAHNKYLPTLAGS